MKNLLLWLCFFVFWTYYKASCRSNVKDVETVDGGLGVHVSNTFLNSIKLNFLPQIFKKLEILPIPDQEFSMMVLKKFNVTINLSNIKVRNIGCDLQSSEMKFEANSPNLFVNMINLVLNFTFDYSIVSNPDAYRDIGNATIYFFPLNISFGMNTFSKNGMIQIEFDDFRYQFEDYNFNFTGGGKLSFLIEAIAESVKDIIKADVSPNILALLHLLIEPKINEYLLKIPTSLNLLGMTLDYAIMDYSQYTDYDFNIVLKGEVRPQNESTIPFVQDRRVPRDLIQTGEGIQAFISDYFIHSLLYSVYKTGLLTFRITDNPLSPGKPLTIGEIAILLPSLAKKYPKSTPIFLDFQSTRGFSPMFNVTKGETYLTLQFDMGLGVNPAQGQEDILIALLTQMDMTLDFGITSGMKIKSQMTSFTFKLKGVKKDEIGIDQADLNSIFGLVTGIVRNYVNYALNDMQIPIPEIPFINLDLNQTYIKEMDRYLLFETSPKITLKMLPNFENF